MVHYYARRSVAALLRVLPPRLNYFARNLLEKATFRKVSQVHDLPPIFHYWSNRYLRPRFETLGFSSPDDFFAKSIAREMERLARPLNALSLGSGNCDLEIRIVKALREQNLVGFRITCLDLNETMLARGRAQAQSEGLSDCMAFERGDINRLDIARHFDVVIANQCLHHFVELEAIFANIARIVEPQGLFLTSDMIGRNGHQLWPEALAEVERFWNVLPERYKFDHVLRRQCHSYVNYNHADVAFEGVRAQDILSLLVQLFQFDLFVPYACIAPPIVGRRFGWNFDVNNRDDLALIDQIAVRDEDLIATGVVKPTQLIAAMRVAGVSNAVWLGNRSPEQSVRETS
ncbi:MAG: class I SAM-dependent methyltransferase [Tahibacter sp.]